MKKLNYKVCCTYFTALYLLTYVSKSKFSRLAIDNPMLYSLHIQLHCKEYKGLKQVKQRGPCNSTIAKGK